jgi:dynein heavy chain
MFFFRIYRVKGQLRRCFEGIAGLSFDEEQSVTHIHATSGESVRLTVPVNTYQARGQVEKWLLVLEQQIVASLKRVNIVRNHV